MSHKNDIKSEVFVLIYLRKAQMILICNILHIALVPYMVIGTHLVGHGWILVLPEQKLIVVGPK